MTTQEMYLCEVSKELKRMNKLLDEFIALKRYEVGLCPAKEVAPVSTAPKSATYSDRYFARSPSPHKMVEEWLDKKESKDDES